MEIAMPVCYQLYRKSNQQEGAVKLQIVDEEMCAHFNEPVHETRWYYDWHNSIGFRLAMGKTFEQIRTEFAKEAAEDRAAIEAGRTKPEFCYDYPKAIEICNWLEANFTTDSWYEVGKRA